MLLTLLSALICQTTAIQIKGPFTRNFQDFLEKSGNEYAMKVVNDLGETGSFGGLATDGEGVHKQPIVFIHGNSDSALSIGQETASGWNAQIAYLSDRGYSFAEMYGITYGDRDINQSFNRRFNCHDLQGLREFLEDVLTYTDAKKVDVIAHSMGVSLARRIIRGGRIALEDEVCHLGEDISDKIDTLVAISGANYGMCACENFHAVFKACSVGDGFFPGTTCDSDSRKKCSDPDSREPCEKVDYGTFLRDLNEDKKKIAENVISMWSFDDNIIGKGGMVWGRPTSLVPGTNVFKVYKNMTHYEMKTDTVKDQYEAITRHFI